MKPDIGIRLLPEWESKANIYIGFRTHDIGEQFDYATIRIIKKLSEKEAVKVIVQDSLLLPEGKSFFAKHDCDTSNIEIVVEELTYFWIRDPAPIFYVDRDQVGVADFRFGYYANLDLDTVSTEDIPMELYDRYFAEKNALISVQSDLSIEGGAFETNGQGTVILVESVILNRNPGWTKSQIEIELETKFNVKTVIWFPNGLAEDPDYMGHLYENFYGFGTGGHSDEFVRFVNDTTVFLAWEFSNPDPDFPLRGINRQRMFVNDSIISNTIDWRGQSFSVVKIPIPEIFYKTVEADPGTVEYLLNEYPGLALENGDTINLVACAGYLNYMITNSYVIIPEYWSYSVPEIQREKDSLVLNIFQNYYSDREIIQINPLTLNYAGGGMHCIYFTVPEI